MKHCIAVQLWNSQENNFKGNGQTQTSKGQDINTAFHWTFLASPGIIYQNVTPIWANTALYGYIFLFNHFLFQIKKKDSIPICNFV